MCCSVTKHGADINQSASKNNITPVMIACVRGHDKCLKLLLDEGADVIVSNAINQTCLIQACQFDHIKCAIILLQYGVDVNQFGNSNMTPITLKQMVPPHLHN